VDEPREPSVFQVPTMLSSESVRTVLDSVPDALVIVDMSGTIVFANQQVPPLFGYEVSEITGQPVEVLLPQRLRTRHIAHRLSYSQNVRVRPMGNGLNLFACRKDGTEFPVEISLSPMNNKGQLLATATIRDVTERRVIERQLEEARQIAERANLAKSRFLATASHDLRQPLQTLALLNGAQQRMIRDPEAAEAVAQEGQAISAMSRLLNALLDISKLESGAIKPEVTDFTVAGIFAELRAEFAAVAEGKGLRLEVEPCTDCVRSDPSLVEQVLRNLVSNAIKYTRHGFVHLRCLHDAAFVSVEVLDTGIGIPPDALGRIYDEFYQVDVPSNTSREGYGLGLSIVHRIVNLLGLRLEVQSEPGKGSRFSLLLPAGSVQNDLDSQRPASFGKSASPRSASAHILLVEDDTGVRRATRTFFMAEGYKVSAAASLSEALEHATEHPDITLLVTDYHLANDETGVDVIAKVRERLTPDLRAILVTGDTSTAARNLHHDERLRIASKPIDADQLLSVVRELLDG
jgi:PAS domain S-box-containing protein